MRENQTENVSHSRLKAFRACRMRHHIRYHLGYRPVGETPEQAGGRAFQAWACAWLENSAGWTPGMHDLLASPDPFEEARLRAMALAYHARWASAPWRWVASELRFEHPVVNPETGRRSSRWRMVGDVDNLVEVVDDDDPEHGLWAVERKVTGGDVSLDSVYWQRLVLDAQVSIYVTGLRTSGREVRGVVYDVVSRPRLEPLLATPEDKREYTQGKGCKVCGGKAGRSGTGRGLATDTCPACGGSGWEELPRLYARCRDRDETPGEYGARCYAALTDRAEELLVRRYLVRLESEAYAHQGDVWATVNEMKLDERSGAHPRNPDACFEYNRPCDYWPVCTGSASLDDRALYQVRTKRPTAEPEVGAAQQVVDDRIF